MTQHQNCLPDQSTETIELSFPAIAVGRSDADLVKRCRGGDESAWNELVDRYQRRIFAIPRRAGLTDDQASDIFQNVFALLFERLDEIPQPEKRRSWRMAVEMNSNRNHSNHSHFDLTDKKGPGIVGFPGKG